MRRWLFGPGAKFSCRGATCITQRLLKTSASMTHVPNMRLILHYRPLLLNVTVPNVHNMTSYGRDQCQRICKASFSSRRQRDPYTVLGVSRSATGVVICLLKLYISPCNFAYSVHYFFRLHSQGNKACVLQRSEKMPSRSQSK